MTDHVDEGEMSMTEKYSSDDLKHIDLAAEYLNDYFKFRREVRGKQEEFKAFGDSISISRYSGIWVKERQLPDKVAKAVAKKDDLERQLPPLLKKLERYQRDVKSSLSAIPNEKARAAVTMWFMKQYSTKEIMARLNISDRHVRRLKSEGLRAMPLPEWWLNYKGIPEVERDHFLRGMIA